ncbi:MAG: BCCT family transporter [Rubripirellula sp.]
MHAVVFPAAAFIILSLISICFVFPAEDLSTLFESLRDGISQWFGWLYVGTMSGFLIFAIWLAFGRYGQLRLGTDDSRPEFSRISWFAMLFSAGMGIGLLFYSVAEPIDHFTSPPPTYRVSGGPDQLAMAMTVFHWGLHPWALYAVVGLCLAYFGFRKDMPLSFRSVLEPILGDRVWGRLGDCIDLLAIVATLTGVATSLGIGAQQVNAGLTFLFGLPDSVSTQVILIASITAVATVSVVLGLDAGIRRLSEFNMGMAVLLMVMVILGGGVASFATGCLASSWSYLQLLPRASVTTGLVDTEAKSWLTGWTVFFWAWWIAWSPFVGLFIARVSKGRTIREYIIGVLLVPTGIAIIWLSAFGGTTLRKHLTHQESPNESLPSYRVAQLDDDSQPITDSEGKIASKEQALTVVDYRTSSVVADDGKSIIQPLPTVLFVLLDELFASAAITYIGVAIALTCIILFFVTSSDSASMVIDIIASGGNPDPPVGTRLFWAITEGLAAAALLTAGGLAALQAASLAAALPLTIVLILSCVSLVIALRRENVHEGND